MYLMKRIPKSQFQPNALDIMREVEETREPIILTENGRPSLELKYHEDAIEELDYDPREFLKGSVLSYHLPTTPVADDDWEIES